MSNSLPSGLMWSLPQQHVDLGENEVHLWSIQMDGLCVECCRNLLSSEERERALRFRFETDRRRYIVAHGALRSILASYLNANPADLQFSIGSNGKPKLALGPAAEKFEFNLSHSHAVSLLAVIHGREIGVDVEHVRGDFPFEEVAERFFTPKEVVALRALSNRLQREAFYKCWTSKEAFLKAKGTGLSGELDEVEIILTDEECVQIKGTVPNWCLIQFDPCDGYVGAVVVEGPACEIKCYRWEGLNTQGSHRHS
jgi:4'-phosphopantetheinyl transferase